MALLAAAVIAALCGAAAADAGEDDACTGKGVRPVLVVPGFISSPLYDSSNEFQRVFPILESEPPELFGLLELAQQFEGLTQASSPVGPESGPNDTLPELTGLAGDFILRGVRLRVAASARRFRSATLLHSRAALDTRKRAPAIWAGPYVRLRQHGCRMRHRACRHNGRQSAFAPFSDTHAQRCPAARPPQQAL